MLIKSEDRSNGVSHDFTYDFNHSVEGTYLLKHAFIPNTCYNIDNHNNHFEINTINNRIQIYLTPGNYNSTLLSVEVKNKIEQQVLAIEGAVIICTVSVSPITGKMKIQINTQGNITNSLALFFFNAQQLLGFSQIPYAFIPIGLNLIEITSPNVIHLNYAVSIGIQISTVTNHNYENALTMSCGSVYIPMNLDFGFYKSLPSGDFPQYLIFNRSKSCQIKVINTSNGSPINLNGGNYELFFSKID